MEMHNVLILASIIKNVLTGGKVRGSKCTDRLSVYRCAGLKYKDNLIKFEHRHR